MSDKILRVSNIDAMVNRIKTHVKTELNYTNEEIKNLAGDKVNELVSSGTLQSQIITDKSINANEKIVDGTITKELLDDNIKLEISEENIKNLAGDKVNELVSSGTLQSQIITDKSINANEKIVDGTITKELLDDNIKLELTEVEKLSSQLDAKANELTSRINEVAETGTTMEAVQSKVEEMAKSGEIQSYTLGKGTVTKDKISSDIVENDYIKISNIADSDNNKKRFIAVIPCNSITSQINLSGYYIQLNENKLSSELLSCYVYLDTISDYEVRGDAVETHDNILTSKGEISLETSSISTEGYSYIKLMFFMAFGDYSNLSDMKLDDIVITNNNEKTYIESCFKWRYDSTNFDVNYSSSEIGALATKKEVDTLKENFENIFKGNYIKISNIQNDGGDNNKKIIACIPCNENIVNIDFYAEYDNLNVTNNKSSTVRVDIYGDTKADYEVGTFLNATFNNIISDNYDGRKNASFKALNIDKTNYSYIKLVMYIGFDTAVNCPDIIFKNIILNINNKKYNFSDVFKWRYDDSIFDVKLSSVNNETAASNENLNNLESAFVNLIDTINKPANINKIKVSSAVELKQAIDNIATSPTNNKANKYNQYNIYLKEGIYELYDVLNLTNIEDQTLFKRGLEIPDYVNLIADGKATISLRIPETETNTQLVQYMSTINTYGENYFEGINFIAENCRYCVHDDNGGAYKDRTIKFFNCTFNHKANTIGSWTSQMCYGAGYTGGRKGIFEKCIMESANSFPFFCHTSSEFYMTSPFDLKLENCAFIGKSNKAIKLGGAYGAPMVSTVSINNCYIQGIMEIDDVNNELKIFGGGNSNVTINNNQSTPQVYLVN